MSDALKITFCLRRLPALTQTQFLAYWYDNHAPLVRKHAATLRIARYIQLVPVQTARRSLTTGWPSCGSPPWRIWRRA